MTIRPLGVGDVEMLYHEETSGSLCFRWRLGGLHPDPFTYGQTLWAGVLASFIAEDRDGRGVGIISAYDADHRNQHVSLAAALLSAAPAEPVRRALVASESVALVAEYVFTGWPFRKLYFDVPEFNLAQFESFAKKLGREEGRRLGHIFLDGIWWDLVTLAITREEWETSPHRERLVGSSAR